MTNAKIAVFIIIAILIQITVLDVISVFNIKPDLLLVLVIFSNIYFPFRRGLVVGGICGLLKDIFSSGIFGLNLFSFIVCAFIIQRIKKYLYKDTYPARIFIVFLISVINSFIYFLFRTTIFGSTFGISFLLIVLFESIYTALISPLIFIPFKKCALRPSI